MCQTFADFPGTIQTIDTDYAFNVGILFYYWAVIVSSSECARAVLNNANFNYVRNENVEGENKQK